MITTQLQQHILSMPEKIYTPQASRLLLHDMIGDVVWQHDFIAFSRRFNIPRLQAWYADEGVHYRYSDNMLQSHRWTESLLSVKKHVENISGYLFNSVLLTYYRNGEDFVPWHADDEIELGDAPIIASLSLGASREFHYRRKESGEQGSMQLHDGELIVMQPAFQQYWEHCIPSQIEVVEPRINLTFRNVVMPRD